MAELSLYKLNQELASKADKRIVTETSIGLMSSADKIKLDSIDANFNKYVLPMASTSTLGGVKIGTGLNIDNNAIISVPTVTSSANGLMSSADKNKLDNIGINTNDYVLPKATSSVLGGVIISAGLSIDSMGFLTVDTSQIKANIGVVTTSNNGLMSPIDKIKLDGITAYTLPNATANTLGGIKVGTGLSISSGTLSIPNATSANDGLMSSTDKTKLNNIAANANNYILPVASPTISGGIKIGTGMNIDSNGIVSIPNVTSATNGLMSANDKTKLDSLDSSGSSGTAIAFGFIHPFDDGESPRYIAKKGMTINNVDIYATTPPTEEVAIQVYKNSSVISTVLFSSAGLTSATSSSPISAGDIIYVKIKGSIHGVFNLTVELSCL